MFGKLFQIVLFLLLTTKLFATHDTLCAREIMVALDIYHENFRDSGLASTTYLSLKKFRDLIDTPSYYCECKQRSSFLAQYAKLNLELAYNPHIDTTAKLVYLKTAITANQKAIVLNNDTTSTQHELPQIMVRVFELQTGIYHGLRDSMNYYTAMHRADSTRLWMTNPTPAKISSQSNLNSDKHGIESIIIAISLYNDSNQRSYIDSSFSSQILATDISNGERYNAVKQQFGKYLLELPCNRFFIIETSKAGYVSQVRKYESSSGGKSEQYFNLCKSGVSFYYTGYGSQIPFKENDKIISILKCDTCKKESFDRWIKKIGLVQCSGDSFFLFRKINGQSFNCSNDSILLKLRSTPTKVEWAGPVLSNGLASPLTLLNSVYVVLIPSHVLLPDEKKKMDKILALGKLKPQGDYWYLAPNSMGMCINDIINQLNQLPFVWYAIPKMTSRTQTF